MLQLFFSTGGTFPNGTIQVICTKISLKQYRKFIKQFCKSGTSFCSERQAFLDYRFASQPPKYQAKHITKQVIEKRKNRQTLSSYDMNQAN